MALISAALVLIGVILFTLTAASLGHRLLRMWSLEFPSNAEHLCCSIAVGVICTEVLLFFSQLTGHIRLGILGALAIVFIVGALDFAAVFQRFAGEWHRLRHASPGEKSLAAAVTALLLLEFLAAVAPLTGSDALHYHFTAPLLILEHGFHPNFFLSHSFFCGQSHLLILFGLALGSARLALGLLFLGGLASAAAAACLARLWVTRPWAWVVALIFLSTPVVFWQISSAGAPDLWMAFFVTTAVIVISRLRERNTATYAILAGILAGGVAGTKYTGCIVAASLALSFLWESRSLLRTAIFISGALGAGVWPYARNAIWTGDPMFPFLLHWLAPQRVSAFALASYLADTGAGAPRSLWQLIKFPFFAAIDLSHAGFWQFLGPLVLAFAPLLILVVRNTPTWRTSLIVWFFSALGIGATSGMMRFLLPVLPIALAAAVAGVATIETVRWRFARLASIASVCFFVAFGAAGFILYSRAALSVIGGSTSRNVYLSQHAPNYEESQFVNQILAGAGNDEKTLVFMRHLYYLRVPFVYGNPSASWAIDPSRFQTPDEWKVFFRAQGIRWVVRTSTYPAEIAGPLLQLEAQGDLIPLAQCVVSDFVGTTRISGARQQIPVVILHVKE